MIAFVNLFTKENQCSCDYLCYACEIKSTSIDGSRSFYSKNFGDYNTWYIIFRPDTNNTHIRLVHGSFPPNIKQIELMFSVALICDGQSYYNNQRQIFTQNDNGFELTFVDVDWIKIVGSRQICIFIKFAIVRGVNGNNTKIEPQDFNEYGIV